MSRSTPRRALIYGVGLALAAGATLGVTAPASGVARDVADRPDLLSVASTTNVTLLPGDDSAARSITTGLPGLPGTLNLDVTMDPRTGSIYTVSNQGLFQVDADDGTVKKVPTAASYFGGVDTTSDGTIVVTDPYAGTLLEVDPDGTVVRERALGFTAVGVDVAPDGTAYVTNYEAGGVAVVEETDTAPTDISTVGQSIDNPTGVAMAGNGDLVVSAQFPNYVYRMRSDGAGILGIGSLPQPGYGIAIDGQDNVYAPSQDKSLLMFPAGEFTPTVLARGDNYGFGVSLAERLPAQAITFTSTAPTDATVGDTYIPTATGGGSGNPVTFSIGESSTDVCSIDAETDEVTFDAPGTCTIAADQAGDEEYLDAEQATQDVVVVVPELFITGQVTSEAPGNAAGWYRTPATVTYTCGGGTAPLVCPDPVTRENTQPGFQVARKVTDASGQETKVRTPLQVDTTAPHLKLTGLGEGPYDRTARPVTCTAVDKNSGIDQQCAVTYGRITQGPTGGATRRWTATATDVAGNTTTVSRAFRVKGSAPRPAMPGIAG